MKVPTLWNCNCDSPLLPCPPALTDTCIQPSVMKGASIILKRRLLVSGTIKHKLARYRIRKLLICVPVIFVIDAMGYRYHTDIMHKY